MATVIYALGTGQPPSAIGVIRLSGNGVRQVLSSFLRNELPPPRMMQLRLLRDGTNVLDEAMVVWMPAPHSYTGEDMAELHCHGSVATLAAVVAKLDEMTDVRAAQAGELTRRAFLAGKLDVTSVEGLADLMAARTEAQRQQALQQWRGEGRQKIEQWRSTLMEVLVFYEAAIDFTDEDLPQNMMQKAREGLLTVHDELQRELQRRTGEQVREGIHIAIVGPPNAGKSTLMNQLSQEEVSLVSDTAGTTRDVVRYHSQLDGRLICFYDTAGLGAARDELDAAAMGKTHQMVHKADELWLVLAHDAQGDETVWRAWIGERQPHQWMALVNKNDQPETKDFYQRVAAFCRQQQGAKPLAIVATAASSAQRCYGKLRSRMMTHDDNGESPIITRARVRRVVQEAASLLAQAAKTPQGQEELTAEYVRDALASLGAVTGHGGAEELLDHLFGSLCIGK